VIPPAARSRAALGLTAAAARGRFELQVCGVCGAVQYPPREACRRCLSGDLLWREQPGDGELIAETVVRHSNDPYFRARVPWRVGMVRLDAGPTALVHLHGACAAPPCRVRVGARLDKSGQGVLLAFPIDEVVHMADDRQLREMTCAPKSQKILVTDGDTCVGRAVVRALLDAGADCVWAGSALPGSERTESAGPGALSKIRPTYLDVTDPVSVRNAAEDIGGRIDILINTAEVQRVGGIASVDGVEAARSEMDVNYFGLLRLAQEFGPRLRTRAAAGGRPGAGAWVNLLSVYALANFPPQGTFSASKAAALSLSQCLRSEMRSAGVRVINVFPGPIDDELNRAPGSPKLAPGSLAAAIVSALENGVEDIYPGDVAREWLARWDENPKILEREMSM
jgi:NAD(P)-dependent dehydrogenase (short-subunit alcohol dehydrogenase family)/uncharacterized OB-fold protein